MCSTEFPLEIPSLTMHFSLRTLPVTCINFDAFSLFSSWIRSSCYSSGTARPDSVSISCVLKALSGYEDYWLASFVREIHGFITRGGFDSDVFVGNGLILITYYTKCDNIASARKVFDEMSERDVASWNSMISGYSQSGSREDCKELYKEMLGCADMKPNGSYCNKRFAGVRTINRSCFRDKKFTSKFLRIVFKWIYYPFVMLWLGFMLNVVAWIMQEHYLMR